MNWKIKRFDELSVNELYEICKARYEVFVCEQKIVEENDFDDLDKEIYHIYLEDKGKVIAYARILQSGKAYEEASIGRVLVLNEYRRRGLASELVNKAIDFIKNELKEDKIKISAQLYVKDLYESLGFKVISSVYDEVSIPHVKMIL